VLCVRECVVCVVCVSVSVCWCVSDVGGVRGVMCLCVCRLGWV